MIRDSGSQVLFIQEADMDFCQSFPLTDLGIKHTICFERGTKEFKDYEQLLRQASPDEPQAQVEETDPAMIVYTSGTTGSPKGVTLSHKNCLTNTRHFDLEMRLEHHHVMLLVYPFFHTAGIASIFNVFYVGATLVLALNTVPADILKTIERERVTDMSIVTTLLNALCNVPGVEQYDLSSFRLFGYGAAIMPVEQLKRAIKIFKCGFLGVFGTTEAAPCVTALRVMDHEAAMTHEDQRKLLASCGRPMVGVETRIVDPGEKDVAIGEVGEFCLRGENVMLGYWNKPEETAFALRNGWYHTGDLARQDEEGYVYIVDRIKDIIISGGENIASREVEEVIYTLPGVLEVAVIGMPDPYWGESVAAVVVRKPEAQVSENEIVDLCKAKLAPFKKPKSVFFCRCFAQKRHRKDFENGIAHTVFAKGWLKFA